MASIANAHPGHDSNVPQSGIVHYLTSPIHLGEMFVALVVTAVMYFAIRSRLARSNSGEANLLEKPAMVPVARAIPSIHPSNNLNSKE